MKIALIISLPLWIQLFALRTFETLDAQNVQSNSTSGNSSSCGTYANVSSFTATADESPQLPSSGNTIEATFIQKDYNHGGYIRHGTWSEIPVEAEISTEQKLLQYLTRFDPAVRPVYNHSSTVHVSLSLQIAQLDYLNAKRQVLGIIGWLSVRWTSEFLTWDPAQFDGLESIVIPPQRVWLPSYTLDNSASDEVYDETHYKWFRVHVYSDGYSEWEPGGRFESACQIDVAFYPFDDQKCYMKFANWVYTGKQVNLTYHEDSFEELLEPFKENGEWDIVSYHITRKDLYYICCPEPYPEVTFHLHLRRKALFYIMNLILPSSMLSLLVVLVFLLPPDSGEKISMGVTLLLSYSVFILMISESVPNTSKAVPLIGIFMIVMMGMTSVTTAVTVLILRLHHKSDLSPPPEWLIILVFKWIQPMILGGRAIPLLKLPPSENITADTKGAAQKPSQSIYSTEENYNYTYTSIYGSESKTTHDRGRKEESGTAQHARAYAQWKDLAAVVDTFCFWLFLFLTVATSLVILIVMPLTKPEPPVSEFA